MTDKEFNLSEKFRLIDNHLVVGEFEVREFIKRLKDECDKMIQFADECHSESTLEDVHTGRSKQLVTFHSEFCEFKRTIDKLAGNNFK